MTPRPLHRSKALWLGILVLTFLAWAWRMSKATDAGFTLYTPSGAIVANHSNGRVSILHDASLKTTPTRLHFECTNINFDPEWFPPAFDTTDQHYRIAHWLIILLFLLTWSAFLAWRWQRIRQLSEATAPTEPPP